MKKRCGAIRSRIRELSGFTLIELMVSMIILSVGLFAVAHMMVVSARSASYAQERAVALNIAHAAAAELKTRSMGWWRNAQLGPYDGFGADYVDILTDPEPAAGANIADNFIHSMAQFGSDLTPGAGNLISSGQTMPEAYPINTYGGTPVLTPGTIAVEGAVYRIHYVAHRFDRKPTVFGGAFLNNWELIRVLLFVSWDNKEHGEQGYSWATWDAAFWQRHMVVVPVFIRPAHYQS